MKASHAGLDNQRQEVPQVTSCCEVRGGLCPRSTRLRPLCVGAIVHVSTGDTFAFSSHEREVTCPQATLAFKPLHFLFHHLELSSPVFGSEPKSWSPPQRGFP